MNKSTIDHIALIEKEYADAVKKHPEFCDIFSQQKPYIVKKILETVRKWNSEPPYDADNILHEEILESREAFLEGDFDHCIQELAQCGAVILRMMEFVESVKENPV